MTPSEETAVALQAENAALRAQLTQVYKERNNLAITAALFNAAHLEQMLEANGVPSAKVYEQVSKRIGWAIDRDGEAGFDTVVYLEPTPGKQLSFHMSDTEQAIAKMLLPSFGGEWDGTYRGREEDTYSWMQVLQVAKAVAPDGGM